jgi:DNA-binding LytR/AlgR family response regulator
LKTKSKILIVEDEPLIADDLSYILEREGYEIAGILSEMETAVNFLKTEKPDLILLDISLEGDEDGIDLAQIINESFQIPFVFITSFSDKLTINRVKKTNPTGFIVKPFKESDITSVVAIALYKEKTPEKHSNNENYFFVKKGHDLIKIVFDEILYIKAEDNYTTIKTQKQQILASVNLKNIVEKLPKGQFLRVHKSYLVNMKMVSKITHRFVYTDGIEIPIGRNYYAELKQYFDTL